MIALSHRLGRPEGFAVLLAGQILRVKLRDEKQAVLARRNDLQRRGRCSL